MIMPELKWLVIGEKLADGAVMYRDVWDHTPPLAAFVYKWMNIVFGKSTLSLQIISILLVIIQAGILNTTMLNNKAYNQNTYVPAFIYMVLMNSYFDFMTLSPVLMSMTFSLLAMNNLFKRMDNTTRDVLFVLTGVYLGLATLFYLPSILFLLVTILALFLYTGSIIRRILLLIYGFSIVLVLCSVHYFWHDGTLWFHEYFYWSVVSLPTNYWMSPTGLFLSILVPFILLVLSIVKILQDGRYINFQVKIQYVMFYFLLAGVLGLFISKDFSTYQLIVLIPSLAFFVAHYLLTIKNWIVAEGTALLVVLAIIFNFLMTYNGWIFFGEYASYQGLKVPPSNYSQLTEDRNIWVVGDGLQHYQNSTLATPFLNWHFASDRLKEPAYYDNITLIYDRMLQDLPEVIIDEKNVMQDVFDKMPTVGSQYQLTSGTDDLYIKK